MPVITKDVTLFHRLAKTAEPAEVRLTTGDQVNIVREWAEHYLIRTADGKALNIAKQYVDPSG